MRPPCMLGLCLSWVRLQVTKCNPKLPSGVCHLVQVKVPRGRSSAKLTPYHVCLLQRWIVCCCSLRAELQILSRCNEPGIQQGRIQGAMHQSDNGTLPRPNLQASVARISRAIRPSNTSYFVMSLIAAGYCSFRSHRPA